ncbi:MAG TPA: hypothetical protein VIU93_00920 [Gallionellaceae bacterium]
MFGTSRIQNNRQFLLASLTLIVCGFTYFTRSALGGLLPVWSDEFFYYLNAKNFFLNSTLEAAFTYTGQGSILFHADAHGFAYPLLHGTIAWIFGFHPLNIPLTNLSLVALSLLIIFLSANLKAEQKLTMAVCLSGFFVVPFYTFTYMQESLHLFFATVLSLLLIIIYKDARPKARTIVIYLLIILIAALFRNIWLFWSIGLLPLATNKKSLLLYALIFIIFSGIAFLAIKLLYDPFSSGYFSQLTLVIQQGNLTSIALSLITHLFTNIKLYFTPGSGLTLLYFAARTIIAFGTAGLFILSYRNNDRLYRAAMLICFVNLALLLYAPLEGTRSISPLFYLVTIIFVYRSQETWSTTLLVFTLALLPFTYLPLSEELSERSRQFSSYYANTSAVAAYDALATEADVKDAPLVYLAELPKDYSPDLLLLPLQTTSGKPIKYAVNYSAVAINLRRNYDFVLSKTRRSAVDFMKEVTSNSYCTLYRLKK